MGIASSKSCPTAKEESHTEELDEKEVKSNHSTVEYDSSDDSKTFSNCTLSQQEPWYLDDHAAQDGFPEYRERVPLTWCCSSSSDYDEHVTMTDWNIVVHCGEEDDDDGEEKVFHVHRNMLALGDRRCDYFANLFRSRQVENNNTSHIELKHDGDRFAFVCMLDFVYKGQLVIGTETAVPLRSLAVHFGCHALLQRVDDFIEEDMHIEEEDEDDAHSCHIIYLRNAFEFKDDHIFSLALSACATQLVWLDRQELYDLPLDLFRAIITHPDLLSECDLTECRVCVVRLSEIVSTFLREFKERGGKVTPSLLIELADRSIFETINGRYVDCFLDLIRDLEPEATKEERRGLQDLCYRCRAEAKCENPLRQARKYLNDKWNSLDWNERELLMQLGYATHEAEAKASRSHLLVDTCTSLKRQLEEDCEELRQTKRRLLVQTLAASASDAPEFVLD